jgi:hypothetical protein
MNRQWNKAQAIWFPSRLKQISLPMRRAGAELLLGPVQQWESMISGHCVFNFD